MDRGGKNDLVCSYCKKPGHHKDKCWQLHGRPPHLAKAHAVQNSHKGGGLNATSEHMPSAQDFQKMLQEIQHLKIVLNSTSVIGSTSMANSSKNEIFSSLTFFYEKSDSPLDLRLWSNGSYDTTISYFYII